MTAPTSLPADLVEAYRQLARSREQDWLDTSSDAAWDYRQASRAIRLHPFWRTLPNPTAVGEVGRHLRTMTVPSEDGEREVVPHLPLTMSDLDFDSPYSVAPALRSEYAARLDAAGLWDRLPERLRTQERDYAEASGSDMRHELDYRDRQFFADGEKLSECGAEELLDELAPSLAELGLALDVVTLSTPFDAHSASNHDYILVINGVNCTVFTVEEWQNADSWYLATVRPLIVINELLEAVGARERLYMDVPGGNEGVVYLLPAEARAVLVDPKYNRWSESGLLPMERSRWSSPVDHPVSEPSED